MCNSVINDHTSRYVYICQPIPIKETPLTKSFGIVESKHALSNDLSSLEGK